MPKTLRGLSVEEIADIVMFFKTGNCTKPDCDKDGTPINRCGGCWDCVVDQVLEGIGKRIAQAIYDAQFKDTEESK